ncbi:MAG TPA: hypothetical protein VJM33_09065 [Microthrixaceae bacterium]|nr:hypothetical protein [Microthrixaceae bacterium]
MPRKHRSWVSGTTGPLPPGDPWARPAGVDDATVRACGTLGEGFERLERARGHLYAFHQLLGRADFCFSEAADELADAGHEELATRIRREVVGRNVLEGRWTYQVVEEFDGCYFGPVADVERVVRDRLLEGRRHVYEAELKEQRRSHDLPGHERRPRPAEAR